MLLNLESLLVNPENLEKKTELIWNIYRLESIYKKVASKYYYGRTIFDNKSHHWQKAD